MCAHVFVYTLRDNLLPSQNTLPSCRTGAKDLNEMSDEKAHMDTKERSV